MSTYPNCRPLYLLALISSCLLSAGTAQAASEDGTLTVSAEIAATCTVSDGTLAFGSSYTGASDVDGSGTVVVTCTHDTPWKVGLKATTTLSMVGTGGAVGHSLTYILYADSARTNTLGVASTEVDNAKLVTGNGTAANQDAVIYGRIPSGQGASVHAGSYSQDVAISLEY